MIGPREIVDTCLVLSLLAGCSDRQRPADIEQFGLTSAPEHYVIVDRAIRAAQEVLGSTSQVQLIAGWTAQRRERGVPVFAVRPDGLGHRELVATYKECRCVIVNVSVVENWSRAAVGSSSALLTMDWRDLLGYMLLHEVGHVLRDGEFNGHFDDAGRAGASLNMDTTAQKAREIAADAYAANAIRSALSSTGSQRAVAGVRVAMALSQLSWNLTAHRLLDDFGGTAIKKHLLFWDTGLSHPNLEWRILSVQNMIERTEASQKLLQEFEQASGSIIGRYR